MDQKVALEAIRITSYNVCYTKLLRRGGRSVADVAADGAGVADLLRANGSCCRGKKRRVLVQQHRCCCFRVCGHCAQVNRAVFQPDAVERFA